MGLTSLSPASQAPDKDQSKDAVVPKENIKVKLAYCSPTGTSLNAGILLAQSISDDVELIDQTSYASRKKEIEFGPYELVIMIAPTYGGQIPVVDNLWTNLRGSETPCIVAACFGNRACEMGLVNTQDKVSTQGFKVVGGIKMVAQHTTDGMLGRGRPDFKDQEIVKDFGKDIQAKLASGTIDSIVIKGDSSASVFAKYPVGTIFPSSAKKVYVVENCTKCGTCAAECTANAIDPKMLEINATTCVGCQRCTSVCAFRGHHFEMDRSFEYEKGLLLATQRC